MDRLDGLGDGVTVVVPSVAGMSTIPVIRSALLAKIGAKGGRLLTLATEEQRSG